MSIQQEHDRGQESLRKLFCFRTANGVLMGIASAQVVSVYVAKSILPSPWSVSWIVGMVLTKKTVVPVIDPDIFLKECLPMRQQGARIDSPGHQGRTTMLICMYQGFVFAVSCFDVQRVERTVKDSFLKRLQKNQAYLHREKGKKALLEVDFQEVIQIFEAPRTENTQDKSQHSAPNSWKAATEASVTTQMVMVRYSDENFIIPYRDVIVQFACSNIIYPPSGMVKWVAFLVSLPDTQDVVPVILPQVKNLAQGKSQKEFEIREYFNELAQSLNHTESKQRSTDQSILILANDSQMFGMLVQSCTLVECDQVISDSGKMFGLCEDQQYPVIQVPELIAEMNKTYSLPSRLQPNVPKILREYLVFYLYDCQCASSLEDVSEFVDIEHLKPPTDVIEHVAVDHGGVFVGTVDNGDHNTIPVFDIRHLYGKKPKQASFTDMQKILIFCQGTNDYFGIVVDWVEKLIKATSEQISHISIAMPFMHGVLSFNLGQTAYIVGMPEATSHAIGAEAAIKKM